VGFDAVLTLGVIGAMIIALIMVAALIAIRVGWSF